MTVVIAGLVPAIPINWLRLCDLIIEIAPRFVFFCNKSCFPNARPMLDVFLALNCLIGGVVDFEINEAIDFVMFRVTFNHLIFVLVDAADEIVGDADIKRAAWTTCEDVNIELSHG